MIIILFTKRKTNNSQNTQNDNLTSLFSFVKTFYQQCNPTRTNNDKQASIPLCPALPRFGAGQQPDHTLLQQRMAGFLGLA